MLKLIDQPPRSECGIFQEIIKLLAQADGFVVLAVTNNKIDVLKYHISNLEIVYAAEYVKSKILAGEELVDD